MNCLSLLFFKEISLKRGHNDEYHTNMKRTCQGFNLINELIKKSVRCYKLVQTKF